LSELNVYSRKIQQQLRISLATCIHIRESVTRCQQLARKERHKFWAPRCGESLTGSSIASCILSTTPLVDSKNIVVLLF